MTVELETSKKVDASNVASVDTWKEIVLISITEEVVLQDHDQDQEEIPEWETTKEMVVQDVKAKATVLQEAEEEIIEGK